jgi:hypothetical protein
MTPETEIAKGFYRASAKTGHWFEPLELTSKRSFVAQAVHERSRRQVRVTTVARLT